MGVHQSIVTASNAHTFPTTRQRRKCNRAYDGIQSRCVAAAGCNRNSLNAHGAEDTKIAPSLAIAQPPPESYVAKFEKDSKNSVTGGAELGIVYQTPARALTFENLGYGPPLKQVLLKLGLRSFVMYFLLRFLVVFPMALPATSFAQAADLQSRDETKSTAPRDAVLGKMRAVSEQIQVTKNGKSLDRFPKSVYHYEDPSRKKTAGAVWVFGTTGRPEALVTVAQDATENWIVETCTFSDAPASIQGREVTGVVTFKDVPSNVSPKGSPRLVRSQLKLLARKFKAYQMWDDHGRTADQRNQLRCTTPVYEYTDEKRGVRAGAVFLYCVNGNPEMALMLEARKDNKWHCAFGRMGFASADVTFGSKHFYKMPRIRGFPADRYTMTLIPVEKDLAE